MNPNVDLRQLAVQRMEPARRSPAQRRHLLTRYVVPGAVLLGFLAVGGWAVRDTWLPSRPVTIVPVLATRSAEHQAGAPLFQAAGWIEPRPTPVLVPALAEGVVEKLLVVEGQPVKAGDAIARLIDTDVRLALASAKADLRLREAELAVARAVLVAARASLAQPVHLDAVASDAGALLAKTETEWSNSEFQLRAAETRRALAEVEFKNRQPATGALPALTIERARSELVMATVLAEELRNRRLRLEHEIKALKAKSEALRKQRELLIDEKRRLAEGEANEQVAEARTEQARIAVETAELRLQRMTVTAPCAGRVLDLVARPGSRLMGQTFGGHQHAGTVVTLYDPQALQVRADVRLEDVSRVQPGQPVRIETPAAPDGPLEGEVLFATSVADIQKNTLQVKVAIHKPPASLKPDMLVQVTFQSAAKHGGPGEGVERLRLLVPRQLVETSDKGASVWIADQAAGVARRRAVKLGSVAANDLVEVVEGLNPADKLVAGGREGLSEGERITVLGEDGALGTSPHPSNPKPTRLPRTPNGTGGHGKH